MSETNTFYCLRCEHRFPGHFDAKQTIERSCPKCGSNSVRLETPAAAARFRETRPSARQGG